MSARSTYGIPIEYRVIDRPSDLNPKMKRRSIDTASSYSIHHRQIAGIVLLKIIDDRLDKGIDCNNCQSKNYGG